MKPVYSKQLTGSGMWSSVVSRGKTLRFTAGEAGANLGLLLFNAALPSERYNMPDTLKGQQVFFLTAPLCLHSDMGRILASVTTDTCGWHDTVCGTSDARLLREKYGEKTYQEARNDCSRSGHDCFLTELYKWDLDRRDLVPNLNLFSKVSTDADGNLSFDPGNCAAGDHIDLRLEMDCLVVLNTCPHPLDPSPTYTPKPVLLEVFQSDPPGASDRCRNSRPENRRAFENTDHYHALRS